MWCFANRSSETSLNFFFFMARVTWPSKIFNVFTGSESNSLFSASHRSRPSVPVILNLMPRSRSSARGFALAIAARLDAIEEHMVSMFPLISAAVGFPAVAGTAPAAARPFFRDSPDVGSLPGRRACRSSQSSESESSSGCSAPSTLRGE